MPVPSRSGHTLAATRATRRPETMARSEMGNFIQRPGERSWVVMVNASGTLGLILQLPQHKRAVFTAVAIQGGLSILLWDLCRHLGSGQFGNNHRNKRCCRTGIWLVDVTRP